MFILLNQALIEYDNEQNEENLTKIVRITNKSGMPLPSGRWGECFSCCFRNAKI